MLLGKSRVWIKESLTGLALCFACLKGHFTFSKFCFSGFYCSLVLFLPPPPPLPTRTRPSSPFVFFGVYTENPYYYPQSYLILISLPLPLLGPLPGQIYTALPTYSFCAASSSGTFTNKEAKLSTTYRHLYRVHKPTLFRLHRRITASPA